ncbi:MAG: hypothetical protein BEN19_07360 [Epulopiscium sp. Nuni2H_MBin003]|nr:MAG: hypothetical protein BEN19_07360 [Epulopiscium sp. Nuni2H_MBin003]
MRIGIIGLGLLGGSIAKTLKQINSNHSYIIAYDNDVDILFTAQKENIINEFTFEINQKFADCNIVFICTPVLYIVDIVKQLLNYVKKDCIITDVGSTKSDILVNVKPIIDKSNKGVHFIGGHPMAGSEKSGYLAASDYLFENAYYIITPYEDTPEFMIFILQKIIERLGSIPIVIPATFHDYAIATISHTPHIVASSLVHLVKSSDTKDHFLHTLAAGGFKDITRIASGDPTMWENICISNKAEISDSLSSFIEILTLFKDKLDNNDTSALHTFFNDAKSYRDTFRSGVKYTASKTFSMLIDIKDRPGSIATIATILGSNSINIKDIGIVNHREFDPGILRVVFSTEHERLQAHELLLNHNYILYY